MKALTLIQPWAYAFEYLGKRIENRSWRPPSAMLGRYFAIHGGKKLDKDTAEDLRADGHVVDMTQVHMGAIVGVARLAGWVDGEGLIEHLRTVTASAWAVGSMRDEAATKAVLVDRWWCGPVGWVVDDWRPLCEPVPCKGAQGLWVVPPVEEALVRERMKRSAVRAEGACP